MLINIKRIKQYTYRLQKRKKGFTLLETLVGVFILTLALTGPIYIATIALRSSVESRDTISAYYLAEEAIEVIRNIRDEKSLDSGNAGSQMWLGEDLNDCLNQNTSLVSSACVITRDSTTYDVSITPCSTICPPLGFNPSPNASVIYGQSDLPPTSSKFTRSVYLIGGKISAGNLVPEEEVEVVVRITWQEKGRDKVYELRDKLFNQKYYRYYDKTTI